MEQKKDFLFLIHLSIFSLYFLLAGTSCKKTSNHAIQNGQSTSSTKDTVPMQNTVLKSRGKNSTKTGKNK